MLQLGTRPHATQSGGGSAEPAQKEHTAGVAPENRAGKDEMELEAGCSKCRYSPSCQVSASHAPAGVGCLLSSLRAIPSEPALLLL